MDNKVLTGVVIVIVVIAGIWAITKNNAPKKVTIGVSQITSHVIFDTIKTGIIAGFEKAGYKEGENIVFDFQNAQGDSATNTAIAQKFANSSYDLFIPFGTSSSQALVNLIKDRPIIFASVTDPVTAGIVQTNEKPGGNVTGTSNITLYKEQLELLKKIVPSVKKIGYVYNPGEANAVYGLAQAKKYGEAMGFEFVTAPANNSGEVISAARSIAEKVDAFYMSPDNTVLSAQDAFVKVAIEAKKPLISIEESGVKAGALATLGTNYEKVGERTAEIALRVLKGEKPANIPVLGVTDDDLFINTTTAQAIGITLSQEMLNQAKQVYK